MVASYMFTCEHHFASIKGYTCRVLRKAPEPQFRDHEHCEVLTSTLGTSLVEGAQWGRRRHVGAGHYLWMPDDLPTGIYLLESGGVEIMTIDHDGAETILQRLLPGQVFGEVCFCEYRYQPVNTFARTRTASEIREGSFVDFEKSMRRDPTLTIRLLETFCVRLSQAESRSRILGIRDGRARLIEALRYLANEHGRRHPGNQHLVSVTVSHAEIAALTGMTRPHTTVMMTRLREDGVVAYSRGSALTIDLGRIG